MKTRILLLTAIAALAINFLFAQGGKIDSSFGTNGYVRIVPSIDDQPYNQMTCKGMLITKANKILTCGLTHDYLFQYYYYQSTLTQLKSNGTLDAKFGVAGMANNFFPYRPRPEYSCMALQADKKIVCGAVYGVDANGYGPALTRFNSNGSIDSSFGVNGVFNYTFEAYYTFTAFTVNSIAVQDDGKFLVLATLTKVSTNTRTVVVFRFNADTRPDVGFGLNGTAVLGDVYPQYGMFGSKLLIQKDGKILIASTGYLTDLSDAGGFALVRLNTNGFTDDSFGNGGLIYSNFISGFYCVCTDMALQSNNKILLFGWTFSDNGQVFGLMNINKKGTFNTAFNGNGKLVLTGVQASASAVAVQTDGKIICTGNYMDHDYNEHSRMARVNADGTQDMSFGVNGIVAPDAEHDNVCRAVAIDKDGKIVTAGEITTLQAQAYALYITRYLPDLTLTAQDISAVSAVTETASQSPFIYPNPVKSDAIFTYTLNKAERVSISLYDLNGRVVQSVLQNENQQAGKHQQQIHFSSAITAGNYILVLQTLTGKASIKIIKQ